LKTKEFRNRRMPPKGGGGAPDDIVRQTVDYMVGLVQ